MRARILPLLSALAGTALLLVTACSADTNSATSPSATPSGTPSSSTPSSSTPSSSATPTTSGSGSGSADSAEPSQSDEPSKPSEPAQLPGGGTTIFPRNRVVAYYGGPDGPNLGVLGEGTPEHAAARIKKVAAGYRSFGRPVLPAMELIVDVAQGSPGPDGDYSHPIPDKQVQTFLDIAHKQNMLLILDIQPGRSTFLPLVKHWEKFLRDPSVSIGLDPEWRMHGNQVPGEAIGSSSAAEVNAVGSYVSELVRKNNLPDKLLAIHQFRLTMLPDRGKITNHSGLQTVLHADGFGSPTLKRQVLTHLHFGSTPFHTGFKLFYTEDTRLMSPKEVMALKPRPEMITYQ